MKTQTLQKLLEDRPYLVDFFDTYALSIEPHKHQTLEAYLIEITDHLRDDKSIHPDAFYQELCEYTKAMDAFLGESKPFKLSSLSIVSGFNKHGEKENFDKITFYPSQVISIVGPTGSGKSRLLADIEWTANQDTQTKRQILINDALPDLSWRYSATNNLVAQLSQNMNFVIDATVGEFLQMHAECRKIVNVDEIVQKMIDRANDLAGEKFSFDTNVTALSGGQSRALMIADTAILSPSPIVLIDEIENAGIDRRKAIELLLGEEKIILMATHDPLLCLMADMRIVIQNGGVKDIIETSDAEKETLIELEKMDQIIGEVRSNLRKGARAVSKPSTN